jgi:hypothetical protein
VSPELGTILLAAFFSMAYAPDATLYIILIVSERLNSENQSKADTGSV